MEDEHLVAAEPTKRVGNDVEAVGHAEHDVCPRCGSAEIGTAFSRADATADPVWECHCSECRFRWSVNP